MMRRRSRTAAVLAAATIGLVALIGGPAGAGAADRQAATVSWHAQTGLAGTVDGASASLVRTDDGVSYRLRGADLVPGHAYTLWFVVIDEPESCTSSPCGAGDFLVNAAPDAQVRWGAGAIAGGDGTATFAGHQRTGPLDGWLEDRSFDDARGAEIHLVVNDHGPKLPGYMPGMIHTYRGGCSDDSPFPPVFPPSALADGEPGPNTCRLTQFAVFQ